MNFNSENDNVDRRLDRAGAALWENAILREKTKEYLDEKAFRRIRFASLEEENEYLRDSYLWESAPILPIKDWMDASWRPLNLSTATEAEIASATLDLLERLRRLNQEIWRADHLSNRRLYDLIVHCILPCELKRVPSPRSPNVWNFEFYTEGAFLDASDDSIWLTYYATAEERRLWALEHNAAPPQHQTPPHARRFPSLNGGCDSCNDRR